jgi:Uma2 family endonuclease
MRLSEKWNPEPDLLLIKPEKYKNLMNGRLYGPADLVIEILSKTTIETDLSKKLPEFLRCGVEEVWIINPIDRSIAVHSKDKVKKFLDPESEEIIASAAFPTFKLQVNWIWDRKTNPVMRIIKKLLE